MMGSSPGSNTRSSAACHRMRYGGLSNQSRSRGCTTARAWRTAGSPTRYGTPSRQTVRSGVAGGRRAVDVQPKSLRIGQTNRGGKHGTGTRRGECFGLPIANIDANAQIHDHAPLLLSYLVMIRSTNCYSRSQSGNATCTDACGTGHTGLIAAPRAGYGAVASPPGAQCAPMRRHCADRQDWGTEGDHHAVPPPVAR